MMAALIVWGTAMAAGAFVFAWLIVPGLREWTERPKHRFQDDVRRFDDAERGRLA